VKSLLVIALEGIALAKRACAQDDYARSRRLRGAMPSEPDVGEGYELGYAEGHQSATNSAAEDLERLAAALRESE